VRFQALLMLELLDDTDQDEAFYPDRRRPYRETSAAPLTVAVLNTHPDSCRFLLDGHYHIRYHDGLAACEATVNYIFASQCMLFDGRVVFFTFTAAQFQQLLDEVCSADSTCLNTHVDAHRRFEPAMHVLPADRFALQCHYTFSHAPRSAHVHGTHVRIAFQVKEVDDHQHTNLVMYADVALFDGDHTSRMHIHRPAMCTIVPHFVWCADA
jgi:hypothetical protein